MRAHAIRAYGDRCRPNPTQGAAVPPHGYRAGMSSADSGGWRWWTLVALCAATFMLLVDVTVVQVALPTIQRDLHSGFTDLEWVIDAYALSLASVILTCGALADRFGRKRVFVVGLVVFTGASFACGLAPTTGVLIWSRALQGLGGGPV